MSDAGKRKSRSRGRAEGVRGEAAILVAVGKEEPASEFAFFRLLPVSIGHELLFRKSARDAEGIGTKSSCGVDALRSWNEEASVGQLPLQQCQRLRRDVGAIGKDCRASEQTCLAGE